MVFGLLTSTHCHNTLTYHCHNSLLWAIPSMAGTTCSMKIPSSTGNQRSTIALVLIRGHLELEMILVTGCFFVASGVAPSANGKPGESAGVVDSTEEGGLLAGHKDFFLSAGIVGFLSMSSARASVMQATTPSSSEGLLAILCKAWECLQQ